MAAKGDDPTVHFIRDGRFDDDEFPDGPVSIEWQFDFVTWEYADDTQPSRQMEEA